MFREAKKVADGLAKNGAIRKNRECQSCQLVPREAQGLLAMDIAGIGALWHH